MPQALRVIGEEDVDAPASSGLKVIGEEDVTPPPTGLTQRRGAAPAKTAADFAASSVSRPTFNPPALNPLTPAERQDPSFHPSTKSDLESVGELVPQSAIPALSAVKKYAVDPFNKIVSTAQTGARQAFRQDVLGSAESLAHPVETKQMDPEQTASLFEKRNPVTAGITESATETAAGIAADPRNWPLMGSAAARGFLGKLISRGVTANIGVGTIQSATELYRDWDKLTPQQRAEKGTAAGVGAAFMLMAARPRVGVSSTPEATGASVDVMGGKAGAGVAVTPDEYVIRGGLGSKRGEIRIPRGGQSPTAPPANSIEAPTIEGQVIQPTPGEQALAQRQIIQHRAANVQQGKPAVTPPPPPPAPWIPSDWEQGHISPGSVQAIGESLAKLPPNSRAQGMLEIHDSLSRTLLEKGRVVGPDGSVQVVDSPKTAQKLATQWINDEVKRQDGLSAESGSDKAEKPAVVSPSAATAGTYKRVTRKQRADELNSQAPLRVVGVESTDDSANGSGTISKVDQGAIVQPEERSPNAGAIPGPVPEHDAGVHGLGNGSEPLRVIAEEEAGVEPNESKGLPATSEALWETGKADREGKRQAIKPAGVVSEQRDTALLGLQNGESATPAKPFQKGDSVVLKDGTKATVSFLHPTMSIARVRTESGENLSRNVRLFKHADSSAIEKTPPTISTKIENPSSSTHEQTPTVSSSKNEQVERRTNVAERKRVSEMSSGEMRHLLLSDDKTGLGNERAFHEAEAKSPAKLQAYSDLDGLGAINDKFGHDAGNQLLMAKAAALKGAGVDSYRLHGDEFAHRGEGTELSDKLEKAREGLRNTHFHFIDPHTKQGYDVSGIDFSYGTGKEQTEADRNLLKHKEDRRAAGGRAEKGKLGGTTRLVPERGGSENPANSGELHGSGSEVKPSSVSDLLKDESGSFTPSKIRDFLNEHLKDLRGARELERGIFDLDSRHQARVLKAVDLMQGVNKQYGPSVVADYEQLYHHLEDPDLPLTAKQDEILDNTVLPVMQANNELADELKAGRVPIDNYVHRVVKGKNGWFDRIVAGSKGTGKGNLLSKSAPQTKGRTMMALENTAGDRKVVSIKGGQVTAWKDGQPENLGGISHTEDGKAWEDKNGETWHLTQATTKEIEKNTELQYYHNALASALVSNLQLAKAVDALHFIDALKASPEFKDFAVEEGKSNPPEGWRSTQLPQLRGYYFEPHYADIFDRYADRLRSSPSALDQVGAVMRVAMLLNPIMHPLNVAASWSMDKGVTGFMPTNWMRMGRSGLQAIRDVWTTNGNFQDALTEGAPLQSQRQKTAKVTELFFDHLGEGLKNESPWALRAAKAVGMSPVTLLKYMHEFSSRVAWISSDVLFLQAAYEKREAGMSLHDALRETGRTIPDYRLPTHVWGSKNIGKLMGSNNLTMFSSYHYGLWKGLVEAGKSAFGLNEKPVGGNRAYDVGQGWNKLALLGLVAFGLYPLLDEAAKKWTGDKHARVARFGPFGVIDAWSQVVHGTKSAGDAFENSITPAPQTKAAVEVASNRELYSGHRVYDPHANWQTEAQQIGQYLLDNSGQIGQVYRAVRGSHEQLGKFGYEQIGIQKAKTRAEKTASDIAAEKMGSQALTPDEEELYGHKREALEELRKGSAKLLNQLQSAGKISPAQAQRIRERARLTPLQDKVKPFTYAEFMQVYRAASPAEKNELEVMRRNKVANMMKRLRGKEVDEVNAEN